MDKITVIIPVKNEEDKIEQCLEAVFGQTIQPFEVIVIDAHSTDNTVGNAKKFPVRVFYEDYHTRAGACQIGVNNAKGDFIAFTDADCIPERNWLENLVKEFDDGIVGVGGGIINIGEGLWEKSIKFAMETFLGSANSVQGRFFRDKRYVKSISGCNSIYRRKDILKVGGFNVISPGAEDAELNRKLLEFGKLIYTPDAIISHNHRWNLKEFTKKMFRYGYERGLIRAFDLQVIPPFIVLFALISLIFTPWIFLSLVGIYLIILLFVGTKSAIHEKNYRYIFSIPIVYGIEHSMYSIGMWKSLIRWNKGGKSM